jgi:hypothetical protein
VTPEEEIWVRALEDTGRYRVLRQLEPRNTFSYPGDAETRLGIILDVAWLHKEIYRRPVELRVHRLTYFNRFSGVCA